MRNDIAFIEAAYAVMTLGAYARAGELALQAGGGQLHPAGFRHDSADRPCRLLHQLRDAIPRGVTVLSVPPPPEILANYKIDPDHLGDAAISRSISTPGCSSSRPMTARRVPQPQNMIYTSGTTGHPKGVRRDAPTPEQTANAERDARA